jgi:hypothetical protein
MEEARLNALPEGRVQSINKEREESETYPGRDHFSTPS